MPVSKKLKRIRTSKKKAPKVKASRKGLRGKKKATYEIDVVNWAEAKCSETSDIDTIIELTKHEDPDVRVKALRELCPCHVQSDIELFWTRIIAMADDPDLGVRKQVLHNLCDGSPLHREQEIMAAVEKYNREKDRDTRRIAHKVMAHYRRTGDWNIL